jgi:nicotinamidase-related amidase
MPLMLESVTLSAANVAEAQSRGIDPNHCVRCAVQNLVDARYQLTTVLSATAEDDPHRARIVQAISALT